MTAKDFPERFIALRDRIEAALEEQFERTHGVDCLGRIAALRADFHTSAQNRLFGIVPTGRTTHCHEYRLLFAVPELSGEGLDDWWAYAVQLQHELVKPDPTHEFSLVSLILATDGFDRASEKKLKRLSSEEHYEKTGATGWSSVRLAVIDLPRGKVYANAMGSPLRDLLKKQL